MIHPIHGDEQQAQSAADFANELAPRGQGPPEVAPLKLIRFNGKPALQVVTSAARFQRRNLRDDC